MYSQHDEESFILQHFGEHSQGRFLDVGAYDPRTFSNTRALVERGWGGTYVEPAPRNFAGFLDTYPLPQWKDITLVNAAVTPHADAGMVLFHDSCGDALSSADLSHVARWETAGVRFRPFWLKTITWDELLDTTGRDYRLLSLDAEGASLALLLALVRDDHLAKLHRLEFIVVEHDGQPDIAESFLRPHGFSRVVINGENILLSRTPP